MRHPTKQQSKSEEDLLHPHGTFLRVINVDYDQALGRITDYGIQIGDIVQVAFRPTDGNYSVWQGNYVIPTYPLTVSHTVYFNPEQVELAGINFPRGNGCPRKVVEG